MSAGDIITWLGWACYAGAAFAIVIYVVHFAGRQGWKRPWNAAGLFFTSLALSQTPSLFADAFRFGELRAALIVTACLLISTALQAMTALRKRRRRGDEDGAASR